MGKNNRARRAAKAKNRRSGAASGQRPTTPRADAGYEDPFRTDAFGRADAAPPWFTGPPPLTDAEADHAIEVFLATSRHPATEAQATAAFETLGFAAGNQRRVVYHRIWARLTAETRRVLNAGWTPLDLHHGITKMLPKQTPSLPADFLKDVLAQYVAGFPQGSVAARIVGELEEIEATQWWSREQHPFVARMGQLALDGREAFIHTTLYSLEAIRYLRMLPPLPKVCPAPGEAIVVGEMPDVDERILQRVRQLLAKAEGTPYEAEAETFTAGAQALMARHSIDAAMLAATAHGPKNGPQHNRLHLYPPYEEEKMSIAVAIAYANRCRTVWEKDIGCVSVVGFAPDLLAVETLFTSLLVQATSAMQHHGPQTDRFGRSATRSFRTAFLASYAARIGERLSAATEHEVAEAQARAGGGNLLPVLAAREQEIDAEFESTFGHARPMAGKYIRNAEGWRAGRVAADRADLGSGRPLPR